MEIDRIQNAMPKTRKRETHQDELDHIVKVSSFLYKCSPRAILEQVLTEPPYSHTEPTGIPMLTAIFRLQQAQGQEQDEQWEPDVLRVLVPLIGCAASNPELSGQLSYSWDNSSILIADERPGYQLPEIGEQGIGKESLSRICDPARTEPLDLNEVLEDAHWLSDDDLFRNFMWATPFTRKMSPFTTSRGYIGYTRVGVQAGAVICAVGACSVPVILRPVGNSHEFLSTCCVIGIMDGRAVGREIKAGLREFIVR